MHTPEYDFPDGLIPLGIRIFSETLAACLESDGACSASVPKSVQRFWDEICAKSNRNGDDLARACPCTVFEDREYPVFASRGMVAANHPLAFGGRHRVLAGGRRQRDRCRDPVRYSR